jgi:hypothetical protein
MNRRPPAIFLAAFVFFAAPATMHTQQRFLLQIRPRVGDTLAVQLDQRVEMTGTPIGSAVARQMTSVTEVFSRAIVLGASSEGASVLALTDSIRTTGSRGGRAAGPRKVRKGDKPINLRLFTDGGAEVVDPQASDEMREVFGQMPAMLSRKQVAVGEKWSREMRIPIVGEAGAMGRVRATFQLDSLSNSGDMAYISMRGTLSHDHRDGSGSELSGTMAGSLQLDRTLGWIVDTRATIDVTSLMRQSPAGPMRVHTKVTQVLHAGLAR